jgi:hypothetical protein
MVVEFLHPRVQVSDGSPEGTALTKIKVLDATSDCHGATTGLIGYAILYLLDSATFL